MKNGKINDKLSKFKIKFLTTESTSKTNKIKLENSKQKYAHCISKCTVETLKEVVVKIEICQCLSENSILKIIKQSKKFLLATQNLRNLVKKCYKK
jgi:hypothetical protein